MPLPLLMPEFLMVVPEGLILPVSVLGMAVLLAAAVKEDREGYIGRVAIFSNAVFLWEIFYPFWYDLWEPVQLWLYFALAIGILALISYFLKESLPGEFYKIAFIITGSLPSFLLVILLNYFLIFNPV
ncbi:MAG: hypothetical protein ACFFD4_38235 [Candidatus Odinarchaeota archaeon]